MAELVRSGTVTRIYERRGGSIPDLVRLDTYPALSIRHYRKEYKGPKFMNDRAAYESSVRMFPLHYGRQIPQWYAYPEKLSATMVKIQDNLREGLFDVPHLGDAFRPGKGRQIATSSLLSRLEQSGPGGSRVERRASPASVIARPDRASTSGPPEVFITGKSGSQYTLSDAQGKTFVLNREAIDAWGRQ